MNCCMIGVFSGSSSLKGHLPNFSGTIPFLSDSKIRNIRNNIITTISHVPKGNLTEDLANTSNPSRSSVQTLTNSFKTYHVRTREAGGAEHSIQLEDMITLPTGKEGLLSLDLGRQVLSSLEDVVKRVNVEYTFLSAVGNSVVIPSPLPSFDFETSDIHHINDHLRKVTKNRKRSKKVRRIMEPKVTHLSSADNSNRTTRLIQENNKKVIGSASKEIVEPQHPINTFNPLAYHIPLELLPGPYRIVHMPPVPLSSSLTNYSENIADRAFPLIRNLNSLQNSSNTQAMANLLQHMAYPTNVSKGNSVRNGIGFPGKTISTRTEHYNKPTDCSKTILYSQPKLLQSLLTTNAGKLPAEHSLSGTHLRDHVNQMLSILPGNGFYPQSLSSVQPVGTSTKPQALPDEEKSKCSRKRYVKAKAQVKETGFIFVKVEGAEMKKSKYFSFIKPTSIT